MPNPRITTVDDLNKFDIGCRVTFKRPASSAGRPVVVGMLLAVAQARYPRGNTPKRGYAITVQYAGRWDWSPNRDEFGPLPANFPITVGKTWIERKTNWAILHDDANNDLADVERHSAGRQKRSTVTSNTSLSTHAASET